MRFLFLIFLSLCIFSGAARADESSFDRVIRTKTINCGYFVAPPYLMKDPNTGKFSGINYDMIEAIANNLGLKVNWAMEPGVGDVGAALSANKIDVMCQTIWPSAARYTAMTFATRPEFYSAIYAMVREGDKRFDGDLSKANNKDVKAAGIEGDFSSDIIKEKLPNAQLVALSPATSLAEFLMQLTTKKADILFFDKGTLNDFAKTNPGVIRPVAGIPPARIFGEHLTVKLGEYKLRDMLDMATMQLVNDGVFENLVKKYAAEYKTDYYPSAKDVVK